MILDAVLEEPMVETFTLHRSIKFWRHLCIIWISESGQDFWIWTFSYTYQTLPWQTKDWPCVSKTSWLDLHRVPVSVLLSRSPNSEESMRKDKHSRSSGKEREKKEKVAPVSRAFSWLSGSSLSRQTRKLFRSHNDLSSLSRPTGQQEDGDDWVYEPQHFIGEK